MYTTLDMQLVSSKACEKNETQSEVTSPDYFAEFMFNIVVFVFDLEEKKKKIKTPKRFFIAFVTHYSIYSCPGIPDV